MTDNDDPFALGGRHVDAELIALEQALAALKWRVEGIEKEMPEWEAAMVNYSHLIERICSAPPRTMRGLLIKLRLADDLDADGYDQCVEFIQRRMEGRRPLRS